MIYNSESKEELSKIFTSAAPSPLICHRVYALKNTNSRNIQKRPKLRKQCQNMDRQYLIRAADFLSTGIPGQVFNYNVENCAYIF